MNKQELIAKIRADPAFLNLLRTQPAKALGVKELTPEQDALIKSVLVSSTSSTTNIGIRRIWDTY